MTDGAAINLVERERRRQRDCRRGSAAAFVGQAAFAISINSGTGVVTVEQYLSLHQDSLTNTPNDPVTLALNSLAVTVTVTDGDGDQAQRVTDVSAQISFADDGPSVTAVGSGVTLALDEGNTNSGAPPISTPATINTGAIVKGDDPDVAGTGYISHAVSAGALVTPTIAFGADGPFGGAPTTGTSFALSVTNPVSGLSVTDGVGDHPAAGERRGGWRRLWRHLQRPGGVCDLDQQRHRRGDG